MSDAQLAQCANQKKIGKISLSTPVFLSGKSHAMARVAMVAQSLEPFLALDPVSYTHLTLPTIYSV